MEQVINESLRLFPPSHALIRDAVYNDSIYGTLIKPKNTIYISVYGIHRNPKYWKNPQEFNPERFDEVNFKKIPKYAFVPFGAGKHSCIGKYLAMPLMKLIIAKILIKFKLELKNSKNIYPISLSTLKPSKEIEFNLELRI